MIDGERLIAVMSILQERERQHKKWGQQDHAPAAWLALIGEEYGELCEAVNESTLPNADKEERGGFENMRTEAVQLAALTLQFIEYMDRIYNKQQKMTK